MLLRWLRKFPAQPSTDALAPRPERADGVQVEPIFAKLAQFGVRVLVNARVSVPPGTLRCWCSLAATAAAAAPHAGNGMLLEAIAIYLEPIPMRADARSALRAGRCGHSGEPVRHCNAHQLRRPLGVPCNSAATGRMQPATAGLYRCSSE